MPAIVCTASSNSPAPLLLTSRLEESVVVGKAAPIGGTLLEEGVAALHCLVGHVRQPGGLAREYLLADESVIDRIERELQHPLRRRALTANDLRPLEADSLQLCVRYDAIHHAHLVRVLRRVGLTQEKDLSRPLLPDLPCQVRRPEAAIE